MRREIGGLILLYCSIPFFVVCADAQEPRRTGVYRRMSELVDYMMTVTGGIQYSDELSGSPEDFFINILEEGIKADPEGFAILLDYGIINLDEYELIREHAENFGAFLTGEELLLLPGINKEKFGLLVPFLLFDRYDGLSATNKFTSASFLSRVIYKSAKSNVTGKITGNPFLIYNRCNLVLPHDISAAFITENDPGEKTADYLSWSVGVKDKGILSSLTLGSYTAVAGQGLILANSFPFSATWDPSSCALSFSLPKKYTSADENRAFKGITASLQKNALNLSIMTSLRRLDARIKDGGYTSLINTGIHSTEEEMATKKSLQQGMAALDFSLARPLWNAGLTLCALRNSLPYHGRSKKENLAEQSLGLWRMNAAANFRLSHKSSFVYGEAASDAGGSLSALLGVVYRHKSTNEYSGKITFRESNFTAPLSSMRGFYGKGLFFVDLLGKIKLTKNSSLRVKTLFGKDYYKISLRMAPDYNNSPYEARVSFTGNRASFRADYRKGSGDNLSFHLRGDLISSLNDDKKNSTGFSLHSELIYKSYNQHHVLSARLTWFNTPAWDTRVYSYERDMLYMFTTSVLYGSGARWYINYRGGLTERTDIWLKYMGEYRSGVYNSEIKAQISFRFSLNRLDFNFLAR